MTHDEIEGLLPLFANGRLQPDERDRVAAHLVDCESCRDALADFETLRQGVQDLGGELPAPSPDLLARTLSRIDAEEPRRPEEPAGRLLAWRQRVPPAARWALAAQLLIILGLVAALWGGRGPGDVTTAGALGPPVVEGQGPRLQVGFSPNATEEEIRTAVHSVGGRLVDGPSRLGLYTVELTGGGEPRRAAEEARRALSATAGVDYVEILSPLSEAAP